MEEVLEMMMYRLLIILLFYFPSLISWEQAVFIENRGQWPERVKYRAEVANGSLWIENDRLTWQFFDPHIMDFIHPAGKAPQGDPVYRQHSYSMRFDGATAPSMQGNRPESWYTNYYIGEDKSKWASNVPVFGGCDYKSLYKNIDVKLFSRASSIKYDIIVHKGGRVEDIRMIYEGDVEVGLDNGQIKIKTSVNEIIENKPYAYQVIDGLIKEVVCSYVLKGHTLTFEIGSYDKSADLVIDPEIAFATYIGSVANNFGATACSDSESNLISSATVFAPGYPVTPGAYSTNFNSAAGNFIDVVISKFSPDGTQLLYSTYLGGSRVETPHSLVSDSQDNYLLLGVTGSNNFPATSGVYQPVFIGGPGLSMNNFFTQDHPGGCDFFISKFSSTGQMLNSTFVGGNRNDGLNYTDQLFYNYGDAFRGEINVDESDNVFVSSVTQGNFPIVGSAPQSTFGGGNCDGVVFKLNPSLSNLLFSTYIGGSGDDACYAIEFAPDGAIIIAGGTRSVNFPHTMSGADTGFNGQTDGFVIKINPASLSVVAGTFIGTTDYDQVYFVQADLSGNIYALGQTAGQMPLSPGVYGQPNSGLFIRKFDGNLATVQWNTTIGTGSGEIDISPTAFLVSDCNQIYFSGWGGVTNSGVCQTFYTCHATSSTTFGLPVTSDAFQSSTDGSDFYLCVLEPDATALVYASYLGGSLSGEHVDGGTSRFDKKGSVYQAVCAGCQGNSDFPTTPNAWSNTNDSFGCNMAVFRFNLAQAIAQVEINGPSSICVGSTAQFLNLSEGATDYDWLFGDGFSSEAFEPGHTYQQGGIFEITLIATDANGCFSPDTTSVFITVIDPVNPSVETPNPICVGHSVQLNATGSPALYWLPDSTLSTTTIPNPIASPEATTTYYAVDFNSCSADTVAVVVEIVDPPTGISPDADICIGGSADLVATGGSTYQWSPATGLSDPTNPATHASPPITTTYSVLITTVEGCEVIREVTITVFEIAPGGNVYPEETICQGSSTQLNAENASAWQWSPQDGLDNPFIRNPFASPFTTTTYHVTLSNPCGTGTSEVTVIVLIPDIDASEGGTICEGQSIEADASGGISYIWEPSSYAFPSNAAHTTLSPPTTMYFVLSGLDENGCAGQDSLLVIVQPLPQVDAGPDQYYDFPGTV
ncbi:MAG: PKD domain-containing protein, partial [Crocinitomicaceae bacterium]|nr:PKD domain-containing protein [Crocinitomicaceae bacterium]